MKKTLVSALTTALVVGAASTTFAASNPFSDVPADHWAYDAVAQLAADGVVEGYGDGTYKGNRNITRYEMAQMVAKAMAKNTSGADKALVDKLAAEFAEELNNLGVRVSNLERNADMVKWNGKAEYTYTHDKDKLNGRKWTNSSGPLLFRLEPTAEVNSNWHVKARLDARTRMGQDQPNGAAPNNSEDNVRLKRIWAQGDYDKFQVKLGKFAPLGGDVFADTTMTGAELSFGKDVKGTIGFGRIDVTGTYSDFTPANWGVKRHGDHQYVGVDYAKDKFSAGAAYHHVQYTNFFYKDNGVTDKLNVVGLKAGYAFNKSVALNAWAAQNFAADIQKKAGSLEVDYKGAQQENKGTWGAWLAYRHMGNNAVLNAGTYDVVQAGQRGWEIGGNYTPFKNVVTTLRYAKTKSIANKDFKHDNFFGRVEFFF